MKNIVCFMLIGLILNSVFYVSSANAAVVPSDSSKEAKKIAKLKMELNKIGIGKESKIEVNLTDGTKVSGYLTEINEEDFVVIPQDDESKRIPYRQVRKARGRHHDYRFAYSASILGLVLGVLLIALSGTSDSRY